MKYSTLDDIIDGNERRNGLKSWYKIADVGISALYDSVIVFPIGFMILKQYLPNKNNYLDTLKLIHRHSFSLHVVEYVDKKHTPNTCSKNIYDTIVATKCSNIILIVMFLAMQFACVTDEKVFDQTKAVGRKIGQMFQAEVF